MKDGNFMITTEIPHQNKKLKIYSRFQASGDITNMIILPYVLFDSNQEDLFVLHSKNMRQKIDSIWFLPKFMLSVFAGFIISYSYWTGLSQLKTFIKIFY